MLKKRDSCTCILRSNNMVGAVLWQNFVCLLWEEARAPTDLRHDSQKFQRRTHECEFSWKAENSFYSPHWISQMLPQRVKSVITGRAKGREDGKRIRHQQVMSDMLLTWVVHLNVNMPGKGCLPFIPSLSLTLTHTHWIPLMVEELNIYLWVLGRVGWASLRCVGSTCAVWV